MLALIFQLIACLVAAFVFTRIVNYYASKKPGLGGSLLTRIRGPGLLIFLLAIVYIVSKQLLPARIFNYIILTIKVATIATSAYVCISLLNAATIFYQARPPMKNLVSALSVVVKILLGICVALAILNLFNINLTAILAGLGVGAIVIGLALQETVSNFFAGLYLATDKPIREGDYIRLDSGQEGYVEKIGWRSTRVRELPDNVIIVPNSKLVNSVITNYYLPNPETACVVKLGVAYNSDLEKVEKITTEVAEQVMKKVVGDLNFKPFIRYEAFGEYSVNFSVIMRVKEPVQKFLLTHEFIKELHRRYKEEGIEIPFPARTIYTKQT
jgi:small-conductance mechanosensitive channel